MSEHEKTLTALENEARQEFRVWLSQIPGLRQRRGDSLTESLVRLKILLISSEKGLEYCSRHPDIELDDDTAGRRIREVLFAEWNRGE